ncbi:hypothetical protein AURDEDRAFT_155439 [Auricularia subglabra TFB-10046 SS5]|nr:hypothetical protein AURDEDRAFT_155439 [Auricularia subglabra TFB-10046 SS5]
MPPRLPGVEGLLQGLDARGQPAPLPQAPPPKASCSYKPLYHIDPSPLPFQPHHSPPRLPPQNNDHRTMSQLVSRTPRSFLHSSPPLLHASPRLSRPQSHAQTAYTQRPNTASDADYSPTSRSPWSSADSLCSDDMATDESPTLRFPAHESALQGAPVDYRARTHKLTCQFCHKTFRRPSTLRTHENVHTRELEFWCIYPGCGKTYNVRGNAYRHVRRAHEIANMIDARKYVVTAGSHEHPHPQPEHLDDPHV